MRKARQKMGVIDCSKCIHCEVCGDRYANDGNTGECSYFLEYNPSGDLISRDALKDDLAKEIKTNDMGLWLKMLLVIDNAPAVEPFTQLEKKEIAAAIKYLLGAELLEENGYTEEVIKALRSALKKVGGEEE